ncbi:MAG: DUF362 domain-containing protein [Planctomycetota bacterium]|jgi:hypothetical protein
MSDGEEQNDKEEVMAGNKNHLNRRDVLKGFGMGVMGVAFGGRVFKPDISRAAVGRPLRRGGQLYQKVTKPARVGLVKGNDRRQITYQALKSVEDDVLASIEGKKKILIKPNFVVTNRQLAATHVDAIRAILDFLRPNFKGEIIVGESTTSKEGTFEGFKNYGYLPLEKEYNVKLVDLNKNTYEYRYIFGKGHRPQPIRIISTFLDPDLEDT